MPNPGHPNELLDNNYAPNAAYATAQHGAAPVGAVCFTWDDGFASHYSTVYALAQQLGQKHTFNVVAGLVGTANYMTSAQIAEISAAGHEIANHSQTHIDMTTASAAQRLIEMDTAQANIDAIIGAGKTTTFTYPLGKRNATTDSELWLRYKRYLLTSTGWSARLTPVTPNRKTMRAVPRFSLDGSTAHQSQAMELIRRASVEPIVVSFYSHDLGAGGSATVAQVQALMNYAASLGVPCLRVDQAFPAEPLLIDGGFEDASLTYWQTTASDGSQIAESVADTPATNLNGSRSLHLKTTTDTSFVYVTQQVPLVPGTKYTISGRTRVAIASGAGGLLFRVRECDALGNQITAPSWTLTATSWNQYGATTNFTADPAACVGYVDVLLNNVTAEAWIDHLDFAPTYEGVFG